MKTTGRKKYLKYYRHHTGYPGGLKEVLLKDMMERKPEEAIRRTLRGMIPVNKLRDGIIEKHVKIYRGPYHEDHELGLP